MFFFLFGTFSSKYKQTLAIIVIVVLFIEAERTINNSNIIYSFSIELEICTQKRHVRYGCVNNDNIQMIAIYGTSFLYHVLQEKSILVTT